MKKSLIITFSFLTIICILLLLAISKGSASVFIPSELLLKENIKRVRLAGRIHPENIKYQVEPELFLSFKIYDPEGDKNKNILVTYSGLKPDMFKEDRDVILDGEFINGEFKAKTLMTQCPSKYKTKEPDLNYLK